MALLDSALGYGRRGWPVFPLLPRAKQPFPARSACPHLPHRHGFKDATLDPDTIQAWWTDHPDANIGIATGRASGLLVVDVDPRSGGDVTLSELIAEKGEWPDTPTVRTGGHGQHFLFRLPAKIRGARLGPGIDLKREGGYIVGAGSVHPSGGLYRWETGFSPAELPLAEPPAWLTALLARPISKGTRRSGARTPVEHDIDPAKPIPLGERHWFLSRTAAFLRFHGVGGADLVRVLRGVRDEHCATDDRGVMTDREIEYVARCADRDIATPPKDTMQMRLVDILLGCMLLGPVPTEQAMEIAAEMGLSRPTLRRVLERLKHWRVADRRRVSGGGGRGSGYWCWGLVGDVGFSGRPLAKPEPGKLIAEAFRLVQAEKAAHLLQHDAELFPRKGRYMSILELARVRQVLDDLRGIRPKQRVSWAEPATLQDDHVHQV